MTLRDQLTPESRSTPHEPKMDVSSPKTFSSPVGFMIRDILNSSNDPDKAPVMPRISPFNEFPDYKGVPAFHNEANGGGHNDEAIPNSATHGILCRQAEPVERKQQEGTKLLTGKTKESQTTKHERKSTQNTHVLCSPKQAGNNGHELDDDTNDEQSEHDSAGKKTRKPRTAFSDFQLQALEKSFDRQKYLSVQERMELAAKLNLADAQVKCWFQNRRTKWKRQHSMQFEGAEFYPALHRMLIPGQDASLQLNSSLTNGAASCGWPGFPGGAMTSSPMPGAQYANPVNPLGCSPAEVALFRQLNAAQHNLYRPAGQHPHRVLFPHNYSFLQ